MDFPLTDLMDQDACYHKLVGLLHPDGLACPNCKNDDHTRCIAATRAPVLDPPLLPLRSRLQRLLTATLRRVGRIAGPPRSCSSSAASPRACPPPNWPASWAATASTCWSCAGRMQDNDER